MAPFQLLINVIHATRICIHDKCALPNTLQWYITAHVHDNLLIHRRTNMEPRCAGMRSTIWTVYLPRSMKA